MIETRDGLDALDDILAVDGLTGVYIGPGDLALGLGVPPSVDQKIQLLSKLLNTL